MLQEVCEGPVWTVLEQEVQVFFVLERSVELDDIVMVGERAANISLSKDSLHLVILGDVRFLELLQGELLS